MEALRTASYDLDHVVAELAKRRGASNALPDDNTQLREVAERLFQVCDVSAPHGMLDSKELEMLLLHVRARRPPSPARCAEPLIRAQLPTAEEELPPRAPKYTSDAGSFVFQKRLEFIQGLAAQLAPLVQRSVEKEFATSLGGKYQDLYKYVKEGTASEKPQLKGDGTRLTDAHGVPIVFDEGHDGLVLADFQKLAKARGVELTLVETAILRLYTADLFKAWNNALRGLNENFQVRAPESSHSRLVCTGSARLVTSW